MFSTMITRMPPSLSRNSITRKLLLKDNQSVGSETIGLFALFPFQLSQPINYCLFSILKNASVLALAIVSGAFTPEAALPIYTPSVLQIFVLVNGAIRESDRRCLAFELTNVLRLLLYNCDHFRSNPNCCSF